MTSALHTTRPTSPFNRLLLHIGLALVAWSRRSSSRAKAPRFAGIDPSTERLAHDAIRHTEFR